VLTLINGQHSLAEIARRAAVDAATVCAIARTLVDDGLLIDRTSIAKPRPIVILEPDVQGFQRPLASLLEARAVAPALVPVATVQEVVTAVRRVYPCLVVVNATGETSSVGEAARELRADATLSDIALVAVLDRARPSDRDDLYSAGFDAVLNKPVIIGDLERFIAPHSPHQRKEDRWVRS
jgi:CheY-like chemotaxis protein